MTDHDSLENKRGKRVLLGQIVSVHGIRGDVIIRSYTSVPGDIASYGALTDAAGARSFKLKVVRASDKGVVARIEGIADRTAAEQLRGTDLYVDRNRLPKAEQSEFYHADLIGLVAELGDGTRYGAVTAVQNFGAGDLLEVKLADGSGSEFIAFTDANVPGVDLARGVVIVVPPAFTGDEADGGDDGADGTADSL